MILLPLLAALLHTSAAIFSLFSSSDDDCCTTTEEPESTTEDPCPTTNGYNAMGWETDDSGNVFVGDDNAKFSLIAMPDDKYWKPLAKDWPEAGWFGSQFPDSPDWHGPCPTGPCGCIPKMKTSDRVESRARRVIV